MSEGRQKDHPNTEGAIAHGGPLVSIGGGGGRRSGVSSGSWSERSTSEDALGREHLLRKKDEAVESFFSFAGKGSGAADELDLARWIEWFKGRKIRQATVQARVSFLSSFYAQGDAGSRGRDGHPQKPRDPCAPESHRAPTRPTPRRGLGRRRAAISPGGHREEGCWR